MVVPVDAELFQVLIISSRCLQFGNWLPRAAHSRRQSGQIACPKQRICINFLRNQLSRRSGATVYDEVAPV
jgi:hypothetical protein